MPYSIFQPTVCFDSMSTIRANRSVNHCNKKKFSAYSHVIFSFTDPSQNDLLLTQVAVPALLNRTKFSGTPRCRDLAYRNKNSGDVNGSCFPEQF